MEALRIQDKLGKQNFDEDMKKVFEPITGTAKQTAPETTGAVNDTTRAIEIKTKETTKAINQKEDLIKYAINFDLRSLEPKSEVVISQNTSHFQLRVNPFSEKLFLKKLYSFCFMESHWFLLIVVKKLI